MCLAGHGRDAVALCCSRLVRQIHQRLLPGGSLKNRPLKLGEKSGAERRGGGWHSELWGPRAQSPRPTAHFVWTLFGTSLKLTHRPEAPEAANLFVNLAAGTPSHKHRRSKSRYPANKPQTGSWSGTAKLKGNGFANFANCLSPVHTVNSICEDCRVSITARSSVSIRPGLSGMGQPQLPPATPRPDDAEALVDASERIAGAAWMPGSQELRNHWLSEVFMLLWLGSYKGLASLTFALTQNVGLVYGDFTSERMLGLAPGLASTGGRDWASRWARLALVAPSCTCTACT